MRPLFVALLVALSLLLLAVPLFGLSETAMVVVVIIVVLLFSVIAMRWAVEKN